MAKELNKLQAFSMSLRLCKLPLLPLFASLEICVSLGTFVLKLENILQQTYVVRVHRAGDLDTTCLKFSVNRYGSMSDITHWDMTQVEADHFLACLRTYRTTQDAEAKDSAPTLANLVAFHGVVNRATFDFANFRCPLTLRHDQFTITCTPQKKGYAMAITKDDTHLFLEIDDFVGGYHVSKVTLIAAKTYAPLVKLLGEFCPRPARQRP